MLGKPATTGLLRVMVVAGLAAHVAHGLTGFGGPTVDWLVVQGLYDALLTVATVVCALRAVRHPHERGAWALIAGGVGAVLLGEIGWSAGLGDADGSPTVCDIGYLAFYPLTLAGCARLSAADSGLRSAGSWLDAIGATFAIGAAGVAFVLADVFAANEARGLAAVSALGYPVLDVTLIAVVVGLAAGQGWRLEPRWAVLGAALLLLGVADSIYYVQIAAGFYDEGGVLDSLWPAAMLLVAYAATMPRNPRPPQSTPSLVLSLGLAAIALTVLVVDHLERVPTQAIVLACCAIIAVLCRAMLTFRENDALLTRSRDEALTDGLTGLPNRRALSRELAIVLEHDTPTTLMFFDLDGFKLYNDTYGHPAGDALLVRLAGRLMDAVDGAGTAYRMGGDEFCVLLSGDRTGSDRVELALRERGDGFDVGASFGAVVVPREADDATSAMRLADQRLYAGKEHRRASAGAQATDALLKVLGEREPDLHDHLHHVAHLAAAVAERLGLTTEEIAETRRAAELHDIGKLALPDEILRKPGSLTRGERSFVEQHTVIGERILAAAPALRAVGRIVRASHEHWDGRGYPDGLTGAEIPVGSRIVAACDAYDAMTNDRPYRAAISAPDALAELHRCAGTQFDPTVVAAFAAAARAELSPAGPAGPRREHRG